MQLLATLRANIAATLLGLLAAVLLCVSVYQHVQIHGLFWIDGLNDKLEDCARDRNELRALSDKRNEQRATTGKTIEQAERIAKDADGVAERIERAAPTENCETAPEILNADI